MNSPAMPFWAVARTAPGRERFAADNLTLRGFEVFIPRVRVRASAQWKTLPLFVNYLFVRVVDRWRAIERSPGIISLVKFGETPARCPDEEVGKLLERSDRDGIIRLGARPTTGARVITPGATVAISVGPFASFDAIYAGQTARERELVLITILGASRPVEISAGLLAPH
jgi:transcriptional antiterminator RfaH